jgi:prepilin-type N-terminal cleavage/methylation domain-containing protein
MKKFKKSGFTLVEILIVVGIIAMLATILIPNIVRVRLLANEAAAQATLKSIAVALEDYANDNNRYPDTTKALLNGNPAYLMTDYFIGVYNGFTFTDKLSDYQYEIIATPVNSNAGSRSFSVHTGGVLE